METICLCLKLYEPRHDKTNKVTERPAKTHITLGISVIAVRTAILLVLSCRGSYVFLCKTSVFDDEELRNCIETQVMILTFIQSFGTCIEIKQKWMGRETEYILSGPPV